MLLTSWHMLIAVFMTRILANSTSLLSYVEANKMTKEKYMKQIVPIAVCFSVSLIFANQGYIYLSVSYIQVSLCVYITIYSNIDCAHRLMGCDSIVNIVLKLILYVLL